MADYLKKIDNGLIIEDPKIVLPWSLQKKDLYMINNIKVINENYYTFKITLSAIPFINCAGLHFENDRLSRIDLFNNEKHLIESEIDNIFNNHQLTLEKNFGKSVKNGLLEKLFKQVNKGDIEYKWIFRRVLIIHKLWDRFGKEEVLKIIIKNNQD